ncbi:hypothetical protein A6E15_03940 [Natrinema saccharevitans]|uniref:Uncharacterized protein n=1 Tax=Natrinema saccharevitans TaxID=301967 RepID=A0A1S8ATK9_9EURY|nr:hypothetical protein [Natrinema saccharevitans]OLZ40183.1 hypothetical protein A6E15_03940 [Natrinema saccharevitans]
MSQRNTTETDEEPADERRVAGIDRDSLTGVLRTVRDGVRSGMPAGVAGLASLLSGVRALRRGDRGHAYLRLGAGGLLLAIALDQRRAARDRTGVEPTDVVSTTPDIGRLEGRERDAGSEVAGTSIDIGDAASSPERSSDADAADVDETDVVESGPDAERLADAASGATTADEPERADDAESEPDAADDAESEPDAADDAEPESYEQLGAAAFDEHSSEVPVPQAAFDRTILSLGSEVFWGIREADDAVVVSGQFDPIRDGDGIRYVASSEVDGERSLTVPDAVLNHWDAVAGGGLAVGSGDDLVFLTTDTLGADDQIRVVPEQWLEDALEGGE